MEDAVPTGASVPGTGAGGGEESSDTAAATGETPATNPASAGGEVICSSSNSLTGILFHVSFTVKRKIFVRINLQHFYTIFTCCLYTTDDR